jgi:RNA polymerase sigma-70 factor (ECF subfamily)
MPDSDDDHPGASRPDDPARWLEEHGDVLFRHALRRVRDRETAEDLVQETLLAAVSARDGFRGGSSRRTWLIGILRHKLIDQVRRQIRRDEVESAGSADPAVDLQFTRFGRWRAAPREWQDDPAELLEKKEFRAILASCLEALPGRLGRVFGLRVMDEMESREVCQLLDITPTNLWAIMHRARMRLRACLDAHWLESRENPKA